jgi:hypothetical protein
VSADGRHDVGGSCRAMLSALGWDKPCEDLTAKRRDVRLEEGTSGCAQ